MAHLCGRMHGYIPQIVMSIQQGRDRSKGAAWRLRVKKRGAGRDGEEGKERRGGGRKERKL